MRRAAVGGGPPFSLLDILNGTHLHLQSTQAAHVNSHVRLAATAINSTAGLETSASARGVLRLPQTKAPAASAGHAAVSSLASRLYYETRLNESMEGMLPTIARLLGALPQLRGVPEQAIQLLAKAAEIRSYDRYAHLCHEGAPVLTEGQAHAYVILHGSVVCTQNIGMHRGENNRRIGIGDCCGLELIVLPQCCLVQQRRTVTATWACPGAALALPLRHLAKLPLLPMVRRTLETSLISQLLTPLLVDKFGRSPPEHSMQRLAEAASIVRYGSGSFVCRRGARPRELTFLLSGVVQLTGEACVDSGSRGTSPFSSRAASPTTTPAPPEASSRPTSPAGSCSAASSPMPWLWSTEQHEPGALCATDALGEVPHTVDATVASAEALLATVPLPAVLRLLQNHEQLRVAIATSAARRDAIHADAVSACPVSATLKGGTSPIGRPSSIRPATPHRTPSRPASAPMLSATAQAEPLASLPVSPSWHRAKGAARARMALLNPAEPGMDAGEMTWTYIIAKAMGGLHTDA